MDEEEGLELTEENIEATLDEIRPYLAEQRWRTRTRRSRCTDCEVKLTGSR